MYTYKTPYNILVKCAKCAFLLIVQLRLSELNKLYVQCSMVIGWSMMMMMMMMMIIMGGGG